MLNFIKNLFDFYAYEDDNSSYLIFDNQFKDHVHKLDAAGEKIISIPKVLKRIYIFFITLLFVFLLVRMMTM